MSYLKRSSEGINDISWDTSLTISSTLSNSSTEVPSMALLKQLYDELNNKINTNNTNILNRLKNYLSLVHDTNGYSNTVPNNSDMQSQTYTVPGTYSCGSNAAAQTLKNLPTGGNAFMLWVFNPLGRSSYTNGKPTNYIVQIYMHYSDGSIWYQNFDPWASNGSWTTGRLIAGSNYATLINYIQMLKIIAGEA